MGSFHSGQLRRSSFFGPLSYGQSPHQYDALSDLSTSPRRGDVYQRDLEANYCSNFSCCGLTLGDLHALLQHYEESHVRFEEEDDNGHPVLAGFVDEDAWTSTGTESNNNNSHGLHLNNGRHPQHSHKSASSAAAAAATVAALAASQQQEQKLTPLSFLNAKKRMNGVSLSDIYAEESGFPSTAMTTATLTMADDPASAFQSSVFRTTAAQAELTHLASKKRDLATYSTSFDTHTPMAKKTSNIHNVALSSAVAAFNQQGGTTTTTGSSNLASKNGVQDIHAKGASTTVSSSSTSTSGKTQEDLLGSITEYIQLAMKQGLLPDCGEASSPSYLQAAEDLIRKREELMSIMESIGKSGSSSADKPYRCQVSGCDKAYKNPNGLKYHNQHGHCSTAGLADSEGPESKPYVCTFMECGKRYKNLNGLKYHIEHSHPNLTAALRAHQAGLTSHPLLVNGVFANNQAAMLALTTALSAVEASPMMMAAINAITASAANASANANANNNNNSNNNSRLSPPSDHSPEQSPASSPALRPAAGGKPLAAPSITVNTTLTGHRGGDIPVFSVDNTPMTSPVLGRANLPTLSPLSIKTSASVLPGLATPSSLSPTSTAPKSPTGASQVSTLTAALAAVTVEQRYGKRPVV
ncbi:hypothetical protein BGX34_011110 [Mortierella sp. NVP85]|nr:hypothetical protein BGX34_011110 [Mortierella sp. NVP85]